MVESFFLTLFVGIVLHWLIFLIRRPRGLPPGPLPLPFVGSAYVFMWKDATKVFTSLRQRYGGCVTIYSGCSLQDGLIVVVLDWDSIVQLANNPKIADRPLRLNELRGVSEGIVWAQYDRAKKNRKFLTQCFKTVGLAPMKTTPAEVSDEIERLFNNIDKQDGTPLNPNDPITEAMTSCLLLKAYGRRFDLNDPVCAELFAGGQRFFDSSLFDMLMLPHLKLLKILIRDKMAEAERYMEATMGRWLRQEIEKRQVSNNDDSHMDLVDAYMAASKDKTFDDFNGFVRSLVDVFLGSMDTNSKTLGWSIFYLAHMPDEQERLFKEIDSVVPSNNFPKIEHRCDLPRLAAFMEESARYSCMALVGFPRRCAEPVDFNSVDWKNEKVGYNLPENASVWLQCFTSQFDDNYWLDPHNFRVDRWLNPSNSQQFVDHTHSLPFGIGRRVCVGEQVARNLQFLFLSAFIQQFKWRLDEFVAFDNYRLGLTRIPPAHKIVFTRRD